MKKQEYLLHLRVERLDDGQFLGRCPRLLGLNVQGDSIEEVIRLAPRVVRSLIASMREKKVLHPTGLTKVKTPLRVQVLMAVRHAVL
jgi:predicted RNase H-like HicB family nuclease